MAQREDAAKQAADGRITDLELIDMWGQLILTANAMGILCIEKKKANLGLEILTNAEKWCGRGDILPKAQRNTLRAHVHDSLAFFFYKKGKAMSAASYTRQALEVHAYIYKVIIIHIDSPCTYFKLALHPGILASRLTTNHNRCPIRYTLQVHEKDGNVEASGISLLHSSALQCQAGDFKGAHRSIYQFLAMVEDGRLSFEEVRSCIRIYTHIPYTYAVL